MRHILLSAEIDGIPARIILDSGVGTFALDGAFAARIGLKQSDVIEESGLSSTVPARLVQGVKLTFGPLALNVAQCAVLDLSELTGAMLHSVDALLGRDAFASLGIDLDFERLKLRFYDPAIDLHIENAEMLPLTQCEFGMRLLSFKLEGRPFQALLDSGADRPLYLSPTYVDEHGLLKDRQVSTAMSAGVDGAGVSRIAMFKKVQVGSTVFGAVPTEIPGTWTRDVPTVLGFPMFRRFRLVVEFPRNRLLLAPDPAAIAQPFRKDRAGFGALRVGNRLQIVFVAPGSPAQAADLKVGDEIVAINGEQLDERYFKKYTQNGSKPAGTQCDFALSSGEQKHLVLRDYY